MESKSAKQHEVLRWASLFLKEHNREEAVAPLLLQHYLGMSPSAFYMRMREDVPSDVVLDFQEAIKEHGKTGIPIEHLTGMASFYSRAFSVNRDVLIPRPETEELVVGVLEYMRRCEWEEPPVISDIGTGSGIIAITLALELEHARVYATDISNEALAVAKKNAVSLGADVTFLQGNLLEPIAENGIQPDIIVSNPPYIAEKERPELSDTVREFDPDLALFAADNGLAIYKRLFHHMAEKNIVPRLAAVEIGDTQGESVKQIANRTFPDGGVHIKQDINGKDRMVFVEFGE
ncbi:MAG TPA: peptide chain release factor N(5)-glutamine methyltransferase [Bacillota bacterium]|nr:peptide chain release factor N(5)-glutamine methyltransferase [Bacillota bacterium]